MSGLAVLDLMVRGGSVTLFLLWGWLLWRDPRQALAYARDVYTRRSEGVSIWVVAARDIVASQESDCESFYDPLDDKPYRHASHYTLPDDVNNM